MMKKLLISAIATVALSACVVVPSTQNLPLLHHATQGKWGVVAINGKAIDNTDTNIGFSAANQRFYGNGGCNVINGQYELVKDKLSISNIAATRMACPNMATEAALLSALPTVSTYQREGDKLILLDAEGKSVIEGKALSQMSQENTVAP